MNPNPRLRSRLHRLRGPLLGAALVVAAAGILAQGSGLTRVVVGRADVSVPGREAIVARVEVGPGASSGWHTHPGDEISYVIEGDSVLEVAGQPPRPVKAGESFVIPAGVVHNARNDSPNPIRLVGVYVVEKGKPLATPASAPPP